MKYIITKENENIKINDYLLRKEAFSSSLIKKLKKREDGISVNGLHRNVNYVLTENDILELNMEDGEEDVNPYLQPVNIPLKIIYEDENMTVINKSPNIPTHQSLNHTDDTLANALAYRYRNKNYVFRAVNRLDKDTSGIVVTANNKMYANFLSQKVKNGNVIKAYIAVLKGKLSTDGLIDAPILRKDRSIIEREVNEEGKKSVTEYHVLFSNNKVSVVKAFPLTGRTHQLRVHFSYIGHPIIGDDLYGEASNDIARQALHAYSIEIEGVGRFCADLPSDMIYLLRRYGINEKDIL